MEVEVDHDIVWQYALRSSAEGVGSMSAKLMPRSVIDVPAVPAALMGFERVMTEPSYEKSFSVVPWKVAIVTPTVLLMRDCGGVVHFITVAVDHDVEMQMSPCTSIVGVGSTPP